MATKAEQFRYTAERRKPKTVPATARGLKRRSTTDDGARNLSHRAGKKASVGTEESHSGKASRKSSRTSSNRGKNSTVLEYISRVKSEQPQAQHARR